MSRIGTLDCLAHTSHWRDRHPAEKAAIAGSLLLSALLVPPWPGAALLVVLAAALTCAAVPMRLGEWLRFQAVPALFIVPASLPLLLHAPRAATAGSHLSAEAALFAAAVALRALAASASLFLLVATTPAHDLIGWLRRATRARALVDVAATLYDFIFLLAGQANRLQTAQAARLGYAGPRATFRSSALLAAHLLPSALTRARRRERGLLARGGTGDLATLQPEAPPARIRMIAAAALVLVSCTWNLLAVRA